VIRDRSRINLTLTDYGVTRVDGDTWDAWSADTTALSGNLCLSVHVETDGTAWIGTVLNGLNRCIHIPPGTSKVYIGTVGAGVSLYRPEHLPVQYD